MSWHSPSAMLRTNPSCASIPLHWAPAQQPNEPQTLQPEPCTSWEQSRAPAGSQGFTSSTTRLSSLLSPSLSCAMGEMLWSGLKEEAAPGSALCRPHGQLCPPISVGLFSSFPCRIPAPHPAAPHSHNAQAAPSPPGSASAPSPRQEGSLEMPTRSEQMTGGEGRQPALCTPTPHLLPHSHLSAQTHPLCSNRAVPGGSCPTAKQTIHPTAPQPSTAPRCPHSPKALLTRLGLRSGAQAGQAGQQGRTREKKGLSVQCPWGGRGGTVGQKGGCASFPPRFCPKFPPAHLRLPPQPRGHQDFPFKSQLQAMDPH